jgi:hypothetical protein
MFYGNGRGRWQKPAAPYWRGSGDCYFGEEEILSYNGKRKNDKGGKKSWQPPGTSSLKSIVLASERSGYGVGI